jgi:hypothetical protein
MFIRTLTLTQGRLNLTAPTKGVPHGIGMADQKISDPRIFESASDAKISPASVINWRGSG